MSSAENSLLCAIFLRVLYAVERNAERGYSIGLTIKAGGGVEIEEQIFDGGRGHSLMQL